MKKSLTILALALLIALPVAAAAQAKQEKKAAPAAAREKPEIESSAHGDWQLKCYKFKDGKKFCELLQFAFREDAKSKKKNMLLAAKADTIVVKSKDGKVAPKSRLLLVAPLGTLLPPQLTVKIDDEKPMAAPFVVCIPDGCTADVKLEDPLLDKIKKSKKMQVTYKRIDNKPVTASLSLNGFGAGMQAMAEKSAK